MFPYEHVLEFTRASLANLGVARIDLQRRVQHVEANLKAGVGEPLGEETLAALRRHRWERTPDDRP